MSVVDRRTLLKAALAAAATGALAGPAVAWSTPGAAAPRSTRVFGRSAQGRALSVTTVGDPAAPVRVLVVGCIHGNEPAGVGVVDRLVPASPPPGVALLLVRTVNPDGERLGTRQDARGVDLNRNFPTRWAPAGPHGSTYYPGPSAASEPETRAVMRLVAQQRPAVTVWYHQHLDLVDLSGGDPAVSRRYARRAGMRAAQLQRFGGSVATWQNATYADATAVVVELPARVPSALLARHAGAVLAAARDAARPA